MSNKEDPCMFEHKYSKWAIYDGNGIFCTYVCDACEEFRSSKFRPEILNGPYSEDDVDERIDEF